MSSVLLWLCTNRLDGVKIVLMGLEIRTNLLLKTAAVTKLAAVFCVIKIGYVIQKIGL